MNICSRCHSAHKEEDTVGLEISVYDVLCMEIAGERGRGEEGVCVRVCVYVRIDEKYIF